MKFQATTFNRSLFFILLITAASRFTGQSGPQSRAIRHSAGLTPRLAHQPAPKLVCRIDRISAQDRKLGVNCKVIDLPVGVWGLRFLDQYAGLDRLSTRVFSLKVKDEKGTGMPLEIRSGGLYLFDNPASAQSINIDYEVRLARVLDPSQYALTSSLGADSGFLMPHDLIPRVCPGEAEDCRANQLSLQINVPSGWKIATNEQPVKDAYQIADPQRAIFFLGRLRERAVAVRSMDLQVAITGTWDFSDEQVFELVRAVAAEQAILVDSAETGHFLVTLAPFPLPLTGLRSSGVTVGRTVVLQLNPHSNSAQTFAHFRRHLAHEMFHFYLPNVFRIRENFDWFWEGYSRYFALLTLARLRLIGLHDFLDAIGGEYQVYASNLLRSQISLIRASPEKFADAANYDLVYRKGMLVASLYDLELRWQSRGKYSVVDVMRGLYRNYAGRDLEVGNREVLNELGKWGDFARRIRDDIEGTREIDLAERLKPYGLVVEWGPQTGGRVEIGRAAKISERQRQLLDQLTGDGSQYRER